MPTYHVLDAYSWHMLKTLVSALSVTDPGQARNIQDVMEVAKEIEL